MDFSILIVTFNSEQVILDCINSILATSKGLKVEIIVIDNCSVDNTLALLHANFPKKIILIENASNEGYAAATNMGFRRCQGRYVMCLNPDTVIHPDTLKNLKSFMDQNLEIGLTICVDKDDKGDISLPYHKFSYIEPLQTYRFVRSKLAKRNNTEKTNKIYLEVDWIWGTGLVVRKELLCRDALYSTDNFLFWEEYYLCKEIRASGHKISILTSATIRHIGGHSYKHDLDNLNIARRLSIGLEYRIRRMEKGIFNAYLTNIIGIIDFLPLYLIFSVKLLFTYNEELYFTVANYKAQLAGHAHSLIGGEKYAVHINEKARKVLNRNSRVSLKPFEDLNKTVNQCMAEGEKQYR